MSSWRSLYPFKSEYFAVNDARMHYVDEGQGRPLLMVHGNPTWSFYYRRLISEFRGQYRPIAIDHVGCGLSDKPAQYGYQLEDRIDDLATFVEAKDLQNVTLLAHDWGGAIGLGAVLRCPERFSQLVLFNTSAFPPPFIPKRIAACRLPFLGTLAMRGLNLFARSALWMAVEDRRSLPADVRQGLLAPYDSWANRIAIDRFVKDIPRRSDPTWDTLATLERGLASLDQPCVLIWGMKDWCFNTTCLERMQQLLPHAQTHPIANAGHYVVEEAADEIIEVLQSFLPSATN
ncbi:MAG: alpha/beta fold hydrolase [Pirellulaceae bacterium]